MIKLSIFILIFCSIKYSQGFSGKQEKKILNKKMH
jgi:hypothetical protein